MYYHNFAYILGPLNDIVIKIVFDKKWVGTRAPPNSPVNSVFRMLINTVTVSGSISTDRIGNIDFVMQWS